MLIYRALKVQLEHRAVLERQETKVTGVFKGPQVNWDRRAHLVHKEKMGSAECGGHQVPMYVILLSSISILLMHLNYNLRVAVLK